MMATTMRRISLLAGVARREGVVRAAKIGALGLRCRLMAWEDRGLDRRFGLDTNRPAVLDELTVPSGDKRTGHTYVATPGRVFATAMANLPVDLSDYTFVDFGSGKGRLLLLASRYGFREIVGVEFCRELHETAEANIAKFAGANPQCPLIRSVCTDAARLPLPEGKCVLFFANPFSEEVMTSVLRNVEQSHRRHPRKLYALFHQLRADLENEPAGHGRLLGAGPLFVERKLRHRSPADRFLLASHMLRLFETE